MSEETKNNENTEETNQETANNMDESNAARRLRLLGISTEEEVPAEPIKKASFFENFWYHYKWTAIAVTFIVLVFAIGIGQMVTKITPDIYIMYAGPHYYDSTTGLMNAFKSAMPEDYNGDGEKTINILQTLNYSDEQIEMLEEQAEEEAEAKGEADDKYNFNYSLNAEEYEKFRNEILIGESVICILDPSLYEEIKGDDLLLTLEEALGYTPDSAYDEFAITFKELEFAKRYSIFDQLPDDSLLIIRRVTAMSSIKGKKAEERHKNHVDYFKSMVEFTEPFSDEE